MFLMLFFALRNCRTDGGCDASFSHYASTHSCVHDALTFCRKYTCKYHRRSFRSFNSTDRHLQI